jgi:hypothetical protein
MSRRKERIILSRQGNPALPQPPGLRDAAGGFRRTIEMIRSALTLICFRPPWAGARFPEDLRPAAVRVRDRRDE